MYPSKSNEECFSDQRTYSKSPQGITPSKTCSKSYTESGQSFYESGRTDSGFLSGANLVSDQNLSSDDLSTPVSQKSVSDFDIKVKKSSESYMRLDSGVDVGLNEQFSALSLQQKVDLNDLSCDVKNKCLTSPGLSNSNISEQVTNNKLKASECDVQPVSQPWELYFQQDDDGDT